MVDIIIDSPKEIVESLTALRDRAPAELAEGIWRFASTVMNESAKICPVDTGFLRGSRYINKPVMYEDEINLNLGYSAEYAIYVHENLLAQHKPPTQAKFLEVPLIQHAPEMLEEIVQITMDLITEGR